VNRKECIRKRRLQYAVKLEKMGAEFAAIDVAERTRKS